MSIPKKRIWFVTNGTAKFFYSAPNVRDAETRGREHAVTTGWINAQLWECTNKEICRNEDLPLVEKKAKVGNRHGKRVDQERAVLRQTLDYGGAH